MTLWTSYSYVQAQYQGRSKIAPKGVEIILWPVHLAGPEPGTTFRSHLRPLSPSAQLCEATTRNSRHRCHGYSYSQSIRFVTAMLLSKLLRPSGLLPSDRFLRFLSTPAIENITPLNDNLSEPKVQRRQKHKVPQKR